jgi:hypothetical protein
MQRSRTAKRRTSPVPAHRFLLRRCAAKAKVAAGKVLMGTVARTALFSPESGRLFVAAPGRGNRTAEIMMYQLGS